MCGSMGYPRPIPKSTASDPASEAYPAAAAYLETLLQDIDRNPAENLHALLATAALDQFNQRLDKRTKSAMAKGGSLSKILEAIKRSELDYPTYGNDYVDEEGVADYLNDIQGRRIRRSASNHNES